VCRQHHRHFLLCEINDENVELARKRVTVGVTKNDKQRLLAAHVKQPALPIPKPRQSRRRTEKVAAKVEDLFPF
jgi:hypothetical protein